MCDVDPENTDVSRAGNLHQIWTENAEVPENTVPITRQERITIKVVVEAEGSKAAFEF